jgi:hypothetical protein
MKALSLKVLSSKVLNPHVFKMAFTFAFAASMCLMLSGCYELHKWEMAMP